MDKSLEEQKDFLIGDVLDLKRKVDSLEYLIEKLKEREEPDVKLTFQIFNDLLEFIYFLLWDNITVKLYWLYDKKGQRGLIWYLNEAKSSTVNPIQIDEQIKKIESLDDEIEKVKRFRNRWIAHRDKEPFEKHEEFWAKEAKLKMEHIKKLTDFACEIIQEHFPVNYSCDSGVHIPFLLSHVFNKEDFIYNLDEYGLIDRG